jgi:diaminohydroxyphosphoribosylaminopyrimidine deaminase/5-amino-6-(5-phosphoribosylamino)uracil reductase
MRTALSLAGRGLGRVWPNPAVGCVLVRSGQVVGRGWTQPKGRPHAEAEALARAGEAAQGASAYITLEPCAHHGQTPPCADALIEAGIKRAVVAIEDPDGRNSGAGIARLRAAGVEVETGLCADQAADINAGFFMRVAQGRPLVTLKTATSLDGRIATQTGESRWISGETARNWAQLLRARHDAIMVGIGTALADNPMLDCRLPGMTEHTPVRVIFDSRLRLPLTRAVVATAGRFPTWFITRNDCDEARRHTLRELGVEVIGIEPGDDGYPDFTRALKALAERGITRVLTEGGSHLTAALLRKGLVDRIAWFRSPRIMGGDGVPVARAFGVESIADMPSFERLSAIEADGDIMETYIHQP